jgi:hypothetical protein
MIAATRMLRVDSLLQCAQLPHFAGRECALRKLCDMSKSQCLIFKQFLQSPSAFVIHSILRSELQIASSPTLRKGHNGGCTRAGQRPGTPSIYRIWSNTQVEPEYSPYQHRKAHCRSTQFTATPHWRNSTCFDAKARRKYPQADRFR